MGHLGLSVELAEGSKIVKDFCSMRSMPPLSMQDLPGLNQ